MAHSKLLCGCEERQEGLGEGIRLSPSLPLLSTGTAVYLWPAHQWTQYRLSISLTDWGSFYPHTISKVSMEGSQHPSPKSRCE